ncbi:hypothetical protein QZM25_33025 [Burkholderia contaminans]|uniref:hypothetical protein n=1 Tax=Burkholderia contaminans TaxID=488447 RepID=UPI0026504DDA|nr:hypothetical protein [Burkholderia contaminans]MDN7577440.1 hypothetical protein [Burkholderia contaminans]
MISTNADSPKALREIVLATQQAMPNYRLKRNTHRLLSVLSLALLAGGIWLVAQGYVAIALVALITLAILMSFVNLSRGLVDQCNCPYPDRTNVSDEALAAIADDPDVPDSVKIKFATTVLEHGYVTVSKLLEFDRELSRQRVAETRKSSPGAAKLIRYYDSKAKEGTEQPQH